MTEFGDIGVGTYHFSDGFEDMQLGRVRPGLSAIFGRTQNGGTTEYIEDTLAVKWDKVRHKQNRARLLKRTIGGMNVGDNQKVNKAGVFNTVGSVFPQIMSPGAVEAKQLFDRVPNEPSPGRFTTEQRMRWYSNQLYAQMMDDIVNTFVVKGWESVWTGQMTLDDGSGDLFDWERSGNNDAVATAYWDDTATDIIAQIDARCNVIQDNGGDDPDFMLPGLGTWAAMRKNLQSIAEADNRGFKLIALGDGVALPALPADLQWLVDAGLDYQGWVKTYAGRNMFILTSNERVTAPDASTKTWLAPDDEVLFGYSGSPCDRKFGPRVGWGKQSDEMETAARMGIDIQSPEIVVASQLEGLVESRMFHVKTKPTDQATYFELATYPLFITKNADNFGRYTATLTP